MQSVKSLAKAVSKEMADSLKGTEELLTLALTKAQKDNNTVYLERVPPFAGAFVCCKDDSLNPLCLLLIVFSVQQPSRHEMSLVNTIPSVITPSACHGVCLCLPADVPAITGALLVKSVAPSNLDATSENLFSGLIPDSR
jgi:hypothetical protein